ncbi:MAG TPA: response regulator [Verrucomicrobiae bacterium]|nr:response regulator [Verrucomicrobiae bacterium]
MGGASVFPQTVLVVDDEPSARRFIARVLMRSGYHVIEAGGARAATELVESGFDAIRLIVCDIRMPGTNGLDFANDLAGMGFDLPILYVSGLAGSAVVEGIAKSNPRVILVKPFSANELLDRVREILKEEALASPKES